jgi:hypothetical protein
VVVDEEELEELKELELEKVVVGEGVIDMVVDVVDDLDEVEDDAKVVKSHNTVSTALVRPHPNPTKPLSEPGP